ncbi:MAG: hypothetical protein RQ894_00415 [Candidatus Pacebacteria bacterium]|jgi:hypothetical protein|nr:hypothetical protein [Candidatus Paceibacterota bacterium]
MEIFKNFFQNKKVQLFIFIILISFFSFGMGFIVGSKFYEPNPIIIEKNE